MAIASGGWASGCAVEDESDSQADPTASVQSSIIGGVDIDQEQFRATGALLYGWRYRCTATLIEPDVILTAAHCLIDRDGFGYFGFTFESNVLHATPSRIVPVASVHMHPGFEWQPGYQPLGQSNDVGIAILEEPILDVPPDILLDPYMAGSELAEDIDLLMCGYGVNEGVTIGVGQKRTAVSHLEVLGNWELLTRAGDPQPCEGDSGSPLFVNTVGGRRIAGIVSRAPDDSGGCEAGGIATRVDAYRDWITETAYDRDEGCRVAISDDSVGSGRALALLVLFGWAMRRRRQRG